MNATTAPATPVPKKKWWKRWWVWVCIAALIPIGIMISTLAGIAIMNMGGAFDEGGTATAQALLNNLNIALLSYKAKAGVFPSQAQGLQVLMIRPTTPPIPKAWTPLLQSLPRDPWNRAFVYHVPSTNPAMAYDLLSLGPDGKPSRDDIVVSGP